MSDCPFTKSSSVLTGHGVAIRGLLRTMLRLILMLVAPLSDRVLAAQMPVAVHRVAFVATGPDVRLEVLDWGGHGPPLVFLAGFGNTSHVFDGFAPQFTNRFHVIGITRRGFGASSKPTSGYDTATLAQDVVAILDSLRIQRAILVGHSFAGSELSFLGAYHAERVRALVYLDASYDFAHLYDDPRWRRAFPIPRPAPPSSATVPALRGWLASVMGPNVPDHEIRNLTSNGRGTPADTTLQGGAYPTELARINVPVLAFWAAPRSVKDWFPFWSSLDTIARGRLQASFADQSAVRADHLRTFRDQVRGAHVVRVMGARHYVYLTHPRQVVDGMRAFFASLEPRAVHESRRRHSL